MKLSIIQLCLFQKISFMFPVYVYPYYINGELFYVPIWEAILQIIQSINLMFQLLVSGSHSATILSRDGHAEDDVVLVSSKESEASNLWVDYLTGCFEQISRQQGRPPFK